VKVVIPHLPPHRWTLAILLMATVLLVGCPRILYLDYQPSTSLKGRGPIRIDAFAYAGHPTGLMKQKELQSNSRDPEALFLSQNIGDFFAGALKKELALAGYELLPESTRTGSGTIEQFFLEYVDQQEQRFIIQTTFQIDRKDAAAFTTSCRSARQEVKDWMKSGSLIQQGVKDCIDELIKNAQAAGAL
jgi:hypothetical protein